MASFKWIFVSCLLFLAGSKFVQEKCGTTEDKLYILADLTTDDYTTIEHLSDFVRFIHSKTNVGSKDFDVYLIEPFQEKSIQLDQYNNTAENIISAIEDLQAFSQFNRSIQADYSDLSKALNYTEQIIGNDTSRHEEVKGYIVAGFFTCEHYCRKTVELFKIRNTTFGAKQLILFLRGNQEESEPIIYEEKFMCILINKYLFKFRFNDILNYLCKECSAGWLSFKENRDIFNNTCYKVFSTNSSLNWFDARKYCRTENADLPVIETWEELVFVNKILHNYNLVNEWGGLEEDMIPVGLTNRNNPIKRFQWINGRPFLLLRKYVVAKHFPNADCGAIYYSTTSASNNVTDVGGDDIRLVMGYCERMETRTILCETYINNFVYFVNETVPKNVGGLINRIIIKQNNEFDANVNEFRNEMYSILNLDMFPLYRPIFLNNKYSNVKFDCRDALKFLFYIHVCDNEVDCPNGRDEIYCDKYERFLVKKIHCEVGQNSSNNIGNGECDDCMGRRCSDGTCVPRHWLSRDGENCLLYNTTDGRMFLNATENCRENCKFIETFIYEIVDCNSEKGLNNFTTLSNFTWAPKCLYIRGRSGSPLGCPDMTHLNDCENFDCPDTFFKCYKSYCISIFMVRDNIMDCIHGEDEYFDIKSRTFLFNCKFQSLFITLHPLHVCDGIVHCPLGDDELNCNFICPRGFTCLGGGVVVGNYSEIGVIRSFDIFDIRSRYLNVSGIDLSNIKEAYILPDLLELQASHCKISHVDFILKPYGYRHFFNVNLSYNNILRLDKYGSLKYLFNLRFLSLAANTHLSILDQEIVTLRELHTLDISFSNISVLDLRIATPYNTLRYLNICNTKINKILWFSHKEMHLDFLDIRQTLLQPETIIEFLNHIQIKEDLYTDNFKYCCPKIIGLKTLRHVCHAPYDGISSCEDLLDDVLKRSLLWLVAIISICLNLIVLIFRTVYERGVFKKGYGVFITNLGVSDCIMGVYLLIIAAVDVHFRDSYVLHETDWRHSILCKTSGFLSTLSSETSTFFVLLITLDRFLVIRFPFGEYRLTKLVVIISVVLSWVIGFILALIPIVNEKWTIYSSNAMCLGLPLTTSRQQGWQYAVVVFIVLNCISFICIALGQVLMFFSMSRKSITSNVDHAARREQDITVAKQLFLIALSNFLCWFPICVIGLRSLNGYEASPDTYAWFVIFVLPLNAAVNPLIYTIPVLYKKWLQFKRGVGH